jgi:hypothetical protein
MATSIIIFESIGTTTLEHQVCFVPCLCDSSRRTGNTNE